MHRLVGIVVGLVAGAVPVLGMAACSDDDGGGGASEDAFCETFTAIDEDDSFDSDSTDPAVLRPLFEDSIEQIERLDAVAPEEVADATADFVVEYRSVVALLDRVDYDFERLFAEATPEELEALDHLGSTAAGAPGDDNPFAEIQQYAVDHCGFEPPSGQFESIETEL